MIRNGSGIRDYKPDDFELLSISDMIDRFDLNLLNNHSMAVDIPVLNKFAAKALKSYDFDTEFLPELEAAIDRYFPQQTEEETKSARPISVQLPPGKSIADIGRFLLQDDNDFYRFGLLVEPRYRHIFERSLISIPQTLITKFEVDHLISALKLTMSRLESSDPIYSEEWSAISRNLKLKRPQLMQIVRCGITGAVEGTPVGRLLEFLGQEECIRRLQKCLEDLQEKQHHAFSLEKERETCEPNNDSYSAAL